MADSTETSKHRRAESIGEDDVLETDPEERYYCYRELVGRGKFKSCHKAFDSQIGIDVAWSKIAGENCSLSDDELHGVISDIQRGLDLDHPNIIKCFKCWEDPDRHCINLITELFTSGNLRQYRNLHKHLVRDRRASSISLSRDFSVEISLLQRSQFTHAINNLSCTLPISRT